MNNNLTSEIVQSLVIKAKVAQLQFEKYNQEKVDEDSVVFVHACFCCGRCPVRDFCKQ